MAKTQRYTTTQVIAAIEEGYTAVGAAQISAHYLEICRELLTNKAAQRGYSLRRWAGYYCGHADQMTHYAAVFEKTSLN